MSVTITIPELGEGIDKGDVVNILVAQGDTITEGQPLLEMETGKATVEIPAPEAGTIQKILITEGTTCLVGDPVFEITSETIAAPANENPTPVEAPSTQAPAPSNAAPAKTTSSSLDLIIPNLGEGVDKGEIVNILVAVGDEVNEGDPLLEMETGKASVEVPSPASGKITTIVAQAGATLNVGDPIGTMDAQTSTAAETPSTTPTVNPEAPPPKAPTKAPEKPAPSKPSKRTDGPLPASPSVRKFAREIGIDLSEVPGSGARGRISINDVKAWSRQRHEERATNAGNQRGLPQVELPDFSLFGGIRREKMNTIRKMTVDHMNDCWSTIPHVTQHDYADVTDLEVLRKSFAKKAEAAGTKLTLTAILMKIMGSALKAHPSFNASIDIDSEEIIYKDYINVGCAVDTPKGLVVPVVRDIDRKNMLEIAKELGEIAGNMRDGKITPKVLQGGCITLSNLGGLNGKHFTPIVNSPEVAIIGVGRATMQPVWDGTTFIPRMLMPLSLSYDHRLIDGAAGTRFMRWIVDAIEQPLLISLEG